MTDNIWIRLNRAVAIEGKASGIYANRRYRSGFSITASTLPDFSLAQLGYTQAKMKQLERQYFNMESIDAAKSILKHRVKNDLTSVAFSFTGGVKRSVGPRGSKTMGHCIQTGVLTTTRKRCELDLFYRSTEVTKKFSGDLIFLRDRIVPYLGVTPQIYRFHFANCYWSPQFVPILARFTDIIAFYDEIKRRNPDYYRQALMMLKREIFHHDSKMAFVAKMQQMIRGTEDAKRLEKYMIKNLPELKGNLTQERKK